MLSISSTKSTKSAAVAASELARRNSANAVDFTEQSPTSFDAVQHLPPWGCRESPCETNGQEARSRSMQRQGLRIRESWFSGVTVFVLATALVLMLGLSVAPNLHERLHPTVGSLHECAVTLI